MNKEKFKKILDALGVTYTENSMWFETAFERANEILKEPDFKVDEVVTDGQYDIIIKGSPFTLVDIYYPHNEQFDCIRIDNLCPKNN